MKIFVIYYNKKNERKCKLLGRFTFHYEFYLSMSRDFNKFKKFSQKKHIEYWITSHAKNEHNENPLILRIQYERTIENDE